MPTTLKAWLRLFRAVNLPTVPGDVFAGAVAVGLWGAPLSVSNVFPVFAAAGASVLIYMYGLADNDIVGAHTDVGRPIPQGRISMQAARIARALCLFGAIGVGLAAGLQPRWWGGALALLLAIVLYNRTKSAALMGLCRGLDVFCGGLASFSACPWPAFWGVVVIGSLWTFYVFGVTKYSEGEEADPVRRRRVGLLIGALVYLQFAVLVAVAFLTGYWLFAAVQAALIVLLHVFKHVLPGVSAS